MHVKAVIWLTELATTLRACAMLPKHSAHGAPQPKQRGSPVQTSVRLGRYSFNLLWRDLTRTPAEIVGRLCETVPTLCTDRRQGPFTRSPLPLVACEHRMAWSKAMAARRRAGILLTVDPKILSRWAHRTMVRQATLVSSRSVQNLYRIHLLDKLLLLSAHELGLSGP